MGYLANIIQDARRHSVAGPYAPLPLDEAPRSEIGFANGETAEVDPMNTILSPANPHDAAMQISPEPAKPVGLSAGGKTCIKDCEPPASDLLGQGLQSDIKTLSLSQAQGRGLQTEGQVLGPSGAVLPLQTAGAVDSPQSPVERDVVCRPEVPEDTPISPPSLPREILAGDAMLGKRSRSSSSMVSDKKQDERAPVASIVAGQRSPLPGDGTNSGDEDPRRVTVQSTVSPPLTSGTRENDLRNEGSLLSPTDRPVQKAHITTSEERMWLEESIAIRTSPTKSAESRVHIGRIEVVILAPESPPQSSQSALPAAGLVNRQYLRRL